MSHIFISYSRKDGAFVEHLIGALERYGFHTWQDKDAIAGGEVWKASISRAIREAVAFLIVLSPQSAASENVSKELAVAAKHKRLVMPVRYQDFTLPDKMAYDLAELQWVDFSEQPFEEALEQLVRALGGQPTAALAATPEVAALRDFLVSKLGALGPLAQSVLGKPATPASPTPRPPALPEAGTSGGSSFCIACGTRLRPQNAFCTNCGQPVRR